MDSKSRINNRLTCLAGTLSLCVLILFSASSLKAQQFSKKADSLNGGDRGVKIKIKPDDSFSVVPDDSVSPWEAVSRLESVAPEIFSKVDRALLESAIHHAVYNQEGFTRQGYGQNKSSKGSGHVGGSTNPGEIYPPPGGGDRCGILKPADAKTAGSKMGSAVFEQDDPGRPTCGTDDDGPRRGGGPLRITTQLDARKGGKISGSDEATLLRIEPQILESRKIRLEVIDAYGAPVTRMLSTGPGDLNQSYAIHLESKGKAPGQIAFGMIPLSREPTLEGYKNLVFLKVPGDVFVPFTVPFQVQYGGGNAGQWLIAAATDEGDFALSLIEVLP
jgi:hypothetical protein